jgi:hypothetical protein
VSGIVSKAQVNDLRVSGPLRRIAPVLGGSTVFCSQICSQMSRVAGRSAARRFWTSGFPSNGSRDSRTARGSWPTTANQFFAHASIETDQPLDPWLPNISQNAGVVSTQSV